MQNLNTSSYQPTKFNHNEKGIEHYQTTGKETIAYKKVFSQNFFDGLLDYQAGSDRIWSKENSFSPLDHQLKEGEFAIVERRYSQVGMFDFTTRDGNKINSHADVAFIFRRLESQAVEHAFAVYIDKNSKPSVQWLSMGGIDSTIVDPRVMVDAAQKLKATRMYLVHNHPSGTLKPSESDKRMVKSLKRAFAPMDIDVNAIIINLNSGSYLIFEENSCTVQRNGFTPDDFQSEQKIGVFSFNKQAFLKPPVKTTILSPGDAAQFLSQQRFSSAKKAGYLLLNTRNEIVGNFFATESVRSEAFKEVAGLVSKFGGVNVIAYTNKADIHFYDALKTDLEKLEINLHDVIECESSDFVCQTFEKYKSLAHEGLISENPSPYLYTTNANGFENNYITYKSKNMNTQNTLTEEHLNSPNTEVYNKETYRQMNLDYLTNQIKYHGFGEGLGERLSEKMNELKDAIDLPVTQSFFVAGNPVKKQDVDFSLHFNKGKENDMYFLNSYTAQLKGGKEENNLPQKFYINKGKGFTAKEAFNLLSGRAINKDFTNKAGETYNAWVKLKPMDVNNEKDNRDFQMFGENYGFDLEKTLSKYPIREMESPDAAERLMKSLKKGNMQAVTFVQNGEETSKFISANPQFKNLNVLNHDGSVMFHNNIEFNKSNDNQKQSEVVKNVEDPAVKAVKPARMKR